MRRIFPILTAFSWLAPGMAAQGVVKIPPASKIYINPLNGFETYLAAGLADKKVPVTVVPDRAKADFEITGTQELDKEEGTKGWQKVAEIGLTQHHHGTEYTVRASLNVKRVDSGEVAFAYSVVKSGSKAQQSAAEAFAKHLKQSMALAKK